MPHAYEVGHQVLDAKRYARVRSFNGVGTHWVEREERKRATIYFVK